MRELIAQVWENIEIAPNIYRLRLKMPADFDSKVQPGQFAHIKTPGDKLLRRPISINDFDAKSGIMSFVYQIKGGGTADLARADSKLSLLVPLGNGFKPPEGRVLLAGAGIGCAPLLYAARIYGKNCGAALAFRNKECAFQLDEFGRYASEVIIGTDDGSMGEKGYAHQIVEKILERGGYERVYACGPEPALKLIRAVCADFGIPCYLSLEARMGCGVGACVVCNVKIGDGEHWHYKRCCKDGPVFDGKEVLFDD